MEGISHPSYYFTILAIRVDVYIVENRHALMKRTAKMPEVQRMIFLFVIPPGALDTSLRQRARTKNAKKTKANSTLPAISMPVPESKQKPMPSISMMHANTVAASLTAILRFMVDFYLDRYLLQR